MDRYLAVWNGDAGVEELDAILSPAYRGHLGSKQRTASDLRDDIVAYRERVPGIRFRVEHQFAGDGHIATRLTAYAPNLPVSLTGLNISRWEDGRLAEEWAVWETFGGSA